METEEEKLAKSKMEIPAVIDIQPIQNDDIEITEVVEEK